MKKDTKDIIFWAALIGIPFVMIAAPAVLGYLSDWNAWQIIALVGVLAVGTGAAAWAFAWYAVQTRRAELAALSSDEQAARLLGEALPRCHMSDDGLRDLWNAFNGLPSEAKRAMVLAIIGFVENSDSPVGDSELLNIARSFRTPVGVP